MLYVALSRVRSITKIHLVRPIRPEWLLISLEVADFYSIISEAPHFSGKVFTSTFHKTRPARDFKPRDPEHIDPKNPLFKKGVVFTGDFDDGSDREELWQVVADLGGIPQTSVSGKTDIVVQGNADFNVGHYTSKIRKACQNVQSGKRDTKVISEDTWNELVNPWIHSSKYK